MGYKTELQSNNADLQTILNKVNALPEAGGGGGGSVETCTVTISGSSSSCYPRYVAYTSVDSNGEVIGANQTVSTSSVTVTCVKGSTLAVKFKSVELTANINVTNASLLFGNNPTEVFKLNDNATTASIINRSGGGGYD